MMFVENLSAFLTHPVTATVLLVVGIIGIALELLFFSGGLLALAGVSGFALYFLGFYLAGFAGFGDLAVFGIGLILLILELVVPSFGILSVLGAICLFGGVLMASSDPTQAAIMLGIALLLAIVAISFAIKTFRHRGIWNRFILKEQLTTNKGFTSSPDRSYLIGMTGEAITPLRPAGTAIIQGERVDVVTNGSFIATGRNVVVVEVEGVRVVVRENDTTNAQ
ncbi:membrane-bound ClpP family serine protease [Paenibacillus sp. V4I3]|uniref:NfeD family protein n=1 Tax=unclassified Paenibacillus TaxID=185978 RepID=UPI00277F3316|nr:MULTISPECIES: NfeD family protein [unclassified Paenibacillus]MDQ0876922.1 membrane-bound ClpP family serine protease [Paenibacillus sp. V4I3]MDQ0887201.1 membrane-bound ClpP family serine protease [Paenibacillus sp. V4I9]